MTTCPSPHPFRTEAAPPRPPAQELRDSVVAGTLDVYQKVISSLLPTPTKSHYTFNLRDISRVMQVGGEWSRGGVNGAG